VAVICRGEEARRGDWEEEQLVPHFLGGLQNSENQEDFSDIEKREASGGWKSQTSIERWGGNRKNRKDSRKPSHRPPKGTKLDRDVIIEFLRTDRS
jgi:hypothetical protein